MIALSVVNSSRANESLGVVSSVAPQGRAHQKRGIASSLRRDALDPRSTPPPVSSNQGSENVYNLFIAVDPKINALSTKNGQ